MGAQTRVGLGRSGAARAAVAALLLVALLPTLSFVGHWGEIFAGQADPPVPAAAILDLRAQQAEQAEHARHCHTDLASCSAQPMASGLGLFASRETLLHPPLNRLIGSPNTTSGRPVARTVSPLLPPPRQS